MNKLALLIFAVMCFGVDFMPLNQITKQSHLIVKRSEDTLPEGNLSIECNETLGNCNNKTLNNSLAKENLTNPDNVTLIRLNLTEVCQQNTTLQIQCNGTLVNLTKHCNNESDKNLFFFLHCNQSNNESISSIAATSVTLNASSENIVNSTVSNITYVNATMALNSTISNITVVNNTTVAGNTSLSVNASNTMTPSLSSSNFTLQENTSVVQASRTSGNASSSVQVVNTTAGGWTIVPSTTLVVMEQSTVAIAVPSTIQPTTTLAIAPQSTTLLSVTPQSTTTQSTTPQSATPQSTTPQSTTSESTIPESTSHQSTTPQSTTPQSTTPQSTTSESTTPESTSHQSTTPQTTTSQSTTPESTSHQSTTTEATTPQSTTLQMTSETTTAKTSESTSTTSNPETDEQTTKKTETNKPSTEESRTVEIDATLDKSTNINEHTTATMESPFNSAKNIKFFYVNVLIPVGIGVCGALLIAFSVLLFKCCRRNKVKKVRYFGKPKGYSRNNMDHINLLSHSSDEE